MVVPLGDPLKQHRWVTVQVEEHQARCGRTQGVAVPATQGRAANDPTRDIVLSEPPADGREPGCAVFVGEGMAGRHPGDVGFAVERVRVGVLDA